MRSTIITTLLAAAALLPGIAQAQDPRRGPADGNRGDWQQRRAEFRQQRQEARNPMPQGYAQRPQPAADNGRWQRGERPGGPDARPQAPGQAQGQAPGRPAYGQLGNRDGRGPDRRPDWRGGQPGQRFGQGYGRPGFAADERRRQFQRNDADWNDGFRNENRFADRSDWNNRGWNRGWRNDSRYDWNRYRGADRSRYHLPRYYAPGGWDRGYRRFSIGVTLSSVLFGQNYWIDDAYDYRLPPAYGPYRWVRYYNDALLVDIRYGTVVDTVYDIFW